jgi:glycerophosphoryl diester phosphodiesterase
VPKTLTSLLLTLLPLAAAAQTVPATLDRQGHRGCRGLMPENTIPAMRRALDLGVTTLEMDLSISQDGQVLLSHDPTMNPDFVLTPAGQPIPKGEQEKHRLYQLPYAEIRRYDVGSGGNPKFARQQKMPVYKPLLAEVIDSVEAYVRLKKLPAPQYNIETKTSPAGDGTLHPAPAEFVARVLAVLRPRNLGPRLIIQSFDPRTLELVHQAEPGWRTALLVENPDGLAANLRRLTFRPSIYSPHFRLVTAALVQEAHAQGLRLIPWTVNSAAEMQRLVGLGVDGIITDYPDLFGPPAPRPAAAPQQAGRPVR